MRLINVLVVGAAALAAVAGTGTPGQARDNTGAAVAAGVVGGIAAGAIAADAARRGPVYGAAPVYDEPECRVVVRRFVDDWGRRRTRREEICD